MSDLRRFDFAETLIVDAVKGRTAVLGRVHELMLSSLDNLFGLYVSKKDPLNAEKI